MQALRTYLELTSTTQQAFAERIGVKQPTVSGWLNGEYMPSAEMLRRISAETGITADKLLADDHAA